MPEYLAPGAYVEEASFRAKSIEGVSTSTTAFFGPTQRAVENAPPVVTSAQEFARLCGDAATLMFGAVALPNYLAQAARAFFDNGGRRLVVFAVNRADGALPRAEDYGAAFARSAALDEISLVAAPGCSALPGVDAAAVAAELIRHVETVRDRFAVLDPPPGQTVAQVQAYRAGFDSSRAALYYPWVVTSAPGGGPAAELAAAPSGFVCGIFARTDLERGVHKAPANEVVIGASRFETDIVRDEQDVLNPLAVNCLRRLEGRGLRVWGARTLASDPQWKYVNVRRYFIYLEKSIERGLQWTVFEPDAEPLWSRLRATVEDFLLRQWQGGALQGDRPEAAFFVRCDRTTMTQADIDNGRVVCLIGVAVLKPAEFVVFRIGLKAAGAASA